MTTLPAAGQRFAIVGGPSRALIGCGPRGRGGVLAAKGVAAQGKCTTVDTKAVEAHKAKAVSWPRKQSKHKAKAVS